MCELAAANAPEGLNQPSWIVALAAPGLGDAARAALRRPGLATAAVRPPPSPLTV